MAVVKQHDYMEHNHNSSIMRVYVCGVFVGYWHVVALTEFEVIVQFSVTAESINTVAAPLAWRAIRSIRSYEYISYAAYVRC